MTTRWVVREGYERDKGRYIDRRHGSWNDDKGEAKIYFGEPTEEARKIVARQGGRVVRLKARPTYNHTRGDSPLTPCPKCVLAAPPDAMAAARAFVDKYVTTNAYDHLDANDYLRSLKDELAAHLTRFASAQCNVAEIAARAVTRTDEDAKHDAFTIAQLREECTWRESEQERLGTEWSRATGALADAGTVPTDPIEVGIRALTVERDEAVKRAKQVDAEATLLRDAVLSGPPNDDSPLAIATDIYEKAYRSIPPVDLGSAAARNVIVPAIAKALAEVRPQAPNHPTVCTCSDRDSDHGRFTPGCPTHDPCKACHVEAEIGTEDVPHPVDARLHNCVPPRPESEWTTLAELRPGAVFETLKGLRGVKHDGDQRGATSLGTGSVFHLVAATDVRELAVGGARAEAAPSAAPSADDAADELTRRLRRDRDRWRSEFLTLRGAVTSAHVEVREVGGWHRVYVNGEYIDGQERADAAEIIASRLRAAIKVMAPETAAVKAWRAATTMARRVVARAIAENVAPSPEVDAALAVLTEAARSGEER